MSAAARESGISQGAAATGRQGAASPREPSCLAKPYLHLHSATLKRSVLPRVSELAGHGTHTLEPEVAETPWYVSTPHGVQTVPRNVACAHSKSPLSSGAWHVRPSSPASPPTHTYGSSFGIHKRLAPQKVGGFPAHCIPSRCPPPCPGNPWHQ